MFVCFSAFYVPEGIAYRYITTSIPQSIHILEVNPHQFTIMPARALDKCVGRETVLSMAARKGAFAAINGGFFAVGGYHEGSPCGILKIDDEWYGLPGKPRGAIGWNNDCTLFDRVLTHLEGIDFHIDPQTVLDPQWEYVDHIVGGAPLLVHYGKKITDFSEEKIETAFITLRHARTAVGMLPSGNWVFVVVDGDQPNLSMGMTIQELADFMFELGCIHALNLDGGSSSTLIYQNQVLNQPSGGDLFGLRAVSDAILIFAKDN